MEIYSVSSPTENVNQSQLSNPNSNRMMPQPDNQPQPGNQPLPMQQPFPRTLPPIQRDQTNAGVMPQPVNQSQPPQRPQYHYQPYPNTIQQIQRVQPNTAKLVPPPRDFLVWSIANTVCAVIFTCCA